MTEPSWTWPEAVAAIQAWRPPARMYVGIHVESLPPGAIVELSWGSACPVVTYTVKYGTPLDRIATELDRRALYLLTEDARRFDREDLAAMERIGIHGALAIVEAGVHAGAIARDERKRYGELIALLYRKRGA